MRVGHHPVRRDDETGALQHLLAAGRHTADLDDARPGGGHDGVVGQRGIRGVDRDDRGTAELPQHVGQAGGVQQRRQPRRARTSASCGATSSTWASTFEPRTAAARFGWSDDVSGVASIHAATSTATNCSPTPMIESNVRSARLRIAPRTARPSTTPAISPITTSAEDQEQRDEQLGAGAADVADDVRRQQHAGDRAEHHPDERQQRAERAGTPAGDGGDERDREDGEVKPL